MLELYHHGSSVCAAKVRLALAEKAIAWTGHYLDILAGEQFTPAYLAINPRGAVPAIVHDGTILTESTVICEYLDSAFDGPALRPADPLGQARMRLWTKRVDEEVHPATRPLTYVVTHRHAILARGPTAVEEHIASDPHPGWRARKRRWIEQGFAAPDVADALAVFVALVQDMAGTLAEREWLAGPEYTLADGALTPYLNRLAMLGLAGLWADLPPVARWWDRVQARPSFEPALFAWLPADLRARMEADGRRAAPDIARALAAS
ncbi:MAG: glutathione S-transferase family protein [Croceibacterium sp.]